VRKKIHINMCPILDGYGVMGIFEFPYTPSCEPCLTEPAGGVMLSASLVADFSQLQTVQFPLSRYLGGIQKGGVGWYCYEQRAVHNRATACVVAGGGIFENQL